MLERSEVKKTINDLNTAMAHSKGEYINACLAIIGSPDFEKRVDVLNTFEVMVESGLMEKFKLRCAEAITMDVRFRGAYVMDAVEQITSLPGGFLLSPMEMQEAASKLADVLIDL